VEAGINFIDTADSYGPHVSEELLAEALYPYPEGLIIATKGGFMRSGSGQWTVNAQPEHLRRALEGSLKRLKLNRIELYQLHRVDPLIPFEKTFEFLQQVQQEGLVKHIGMSEVSVEQIKRAQEFVEVVSVQNKYSIGFREWEAELNYCRDHNMAFIPWYPLGAGKFLDLDRLEQVARRHGARPYQVALSWLLHHAPNILLIPGTSSLQHLEENVAAASIRLSEEDMKALG
jgi:pyridoxine 4-dehydrogenase